MTDIPWDALLPSMVAIFVAGVGIGAWGLKKVLGG